MNALFSELRKTKLLRENDHIPVKALFSMVSTGTERLIASAKVNNSFELRMSVPYMEGSFSLPIKYGYSVIGKSEQDQLVHTMHPHQDYFCVSPPDLFKLNTNIPADRLSLISNMETIINAIWDSEFKDIDTIAICGFGNIGSLLANTLRAHYNIEVTIIEQNKWRASKAEELNWKVSEFSDGDHFDIIFHTTGTESGLQACIDHLNVDGKLIELSWYGNKSLSLSLGHNFHYNRIKIISSQVSNIPKRLSAAYDYKKRKELAIKLLADDSYDNLITNYIPFHSSPAFFKDLRSGNQGNGLIWLIKY